MSERSTPETDAYVAALNDEWDVEFAALTSHAKKLERERDEAREALAKQTCERCGGLGWYPWFDGHHGDEAVQRQCEACYGTGRLRRTEQERNEAARKYHEWKSIGMTADKCIHCGRIARVGEGFSADREICPAKQEAAK